jgi:hypothetical protein
MCGQCVASAEVVVYFIAVAVREILKLAFELTASVYSESLGNVEVESCMRVKLTRNCSAPCFLFNRSM